MMGYLMIPGLRMKIQGSKTRHSFIMKAIYSLYLLGFLLNPLLAQQTVEWVSLSSSGKSLQDTRNIITRSLTAVKNEHKIKLETTVFSAREVILKVPLVEMYLETKTGEDNLSYKRIFIPGTKLNNNGKPELPMFRQLLLIPNNTRIKVKEKPGEALIFTEAEIYPSQAVMRALPVSKINFRTPFLKDTETYTKNKLWPGEFYSLEARKTIRGQEFTAICLYPFQYNPVTKELKVYKDLEVTIEFQGAIKPMPKGLLYPEFEKSLKKLAVNAKEVLEAEKR